MTVVFGGGGDDSKTKGIVPDPCGNELELETSS